MIFSEHHCQAQLKHVWYALVFDIRINSIVSFQCVGEPIVEIDSGYQ
jgi:hypothetical protein